MEQLVIIFICIIVVFALYLFLILPRFHKPVYPGSSTSLYAHRGLHDHNEQVPENSLEAFRLACEHGYGIELDVQLTKDRQVVVFHDETLKRMCSVQGCVRDYTYKELQNFFLAKTNHKIPLFSEVLDLVNERVPLIVEIKIHENSTTVCEHVNALLEHYPGPYCIESFHPFALRWYKKNRKDVFRGQLSTNFHKSEKERKISYFFAQNLLFNVFSRPDFIAFGHQYSKCTSRTLVCKLLHATPVCWTIRSQEELDLAKKSFEYYIFEGFIPKYNQNIQ